MQKNIVLKVVLTGTSPEVWRRIQVNSTIPLNEFHHILQIVMGWENYHLFEFIINGQRFGVTDEEFDIGDDEITDAKNVKLDTVINEGIKSFIYLYDFGDGWHHSIEVEDIAGIKENTNTPLCLGGAMNCPPEDCGGLPSFYHLVEVLNDKNHPEHSQIEEWLGEHYDPKQFELALVNTILADLDAYIRDMEHDPRSDLN